MDVPDACQSAKADMTAGLTWRRGGEGVQATCYAEALRAVALARAVDELSAEVLPLFGSGLVSIVLGASCDMHIWI